MKRSRNGAEWTVEQKIALFYEYLNGDIGMDKLAEKHGRHKGTINKNIHDVLDGKLVPLTDIEKCLSRIESKRCHLVKKGTQQKKGGNKKVEKEDIDVEAQGTQWDEWSRFMGVL